MSSRTAIRDPVIFCHSAPDQDPGRNPEKYKGQTISVWPFFTFWIPAPGRNDMFRVATRNDRGRLRRVKRADRCGEFPVQRKTHFETELTCVLFEIPDKRRKRCEC